MGGPPLPLRTGRLLLRAHRSDDLDQLLGMYGDPDVCRYIPLGPWDRAEATTQLAGRLERTDYRGEPGILGLVIDVDGTMVGDVVLFPVPGEPDTAEIGWVLHPDHTGHGYAHEAARAVLDLAFDHYRLHRVVARVDPRNVRSARLCERLGMRREAHHRQAHWARGEWCDVLVHAVLAQERPAEGSTCSTSSSSP